MRPLRPDRRAGLRNLASLLLGFIGIGAAIWASWLNLLSVQAAEEALTAEMPPASAPYRPVDLPIYPHFIDPAKSVARRSLVHTDVPHRARVEVLRYTVQVGDSVFGIADRFSLAPETILWGNFSVLNDDPHLLRPGQELSILPVDGALYEWQAGDSLQAVADFFEVTPQDIADWPGNDIDRQTLQLAPGTELIIPGGVREFRQWIVPTIARGRAGVGTAFGPGGCSGDFSGGAVGSGGFIWPSANRTISGNDYWSGHLAIDIAASIGDLVLAADGGVVVYSGWSVGGYGNMVMIDHGNGWQTLYAHLNAVVAPCGASVFQGQTIGFAGSTGNSTGPHLHFETRLNSGFVNPWFVLP